MKTNEIILKVLSEDDMLYERIGRVLKDTKAMPLLARELAEIRSVIRTRKKIANMLEVAMQELRFITTGHERDDDHHTAAWSNHMRLKAARTGAERAITEIEKIAEDEH